MEKTATFQSHLDKVKTRYKDEKLTHEEACRVVSCGYGIEQLAKTCDRFFLDYKELSKVYRVVEKVLYKLNLYLLPKLKCGLAIRLKYSLDEDQVALLVNTGVKTLERHFQTIKPYLKVTTVLNYNPDFTRNPKLFFLLCYARKHYRRFYKGSLTQVFFTMLNIFPVGYVFEEFIEKIAMLFKEINRLNLNKGQVFAERKTELLEGLLTTSLFKRATVGTLTISSGKIMVIDPNYGDYFKDKYTVKAKNGKWIAQVKLYQNEVEILQIIHESIYKKNKDCNWEIEEWKKLQVWTQRGKIGIFDGSVTPFDSKKKRESFFYDLYGNWHRSKLYNNCGVMTWVESNIIAMKIIKEEGKTVAMMVKSLRKKIDLKGYLGKFYPERFLQF